MLISYIYVSGYELLALSSNSMSLDIWEDFKWNAFSWDLNIDQMPANKDSHRKAELYIYIEERNRSGSGK